MTYTLPLTEYRAARERIRPYVRHTPLAPLPPLTDDLPPQLLLKLENMQVVGSFKPRGVFNTLLQMSDDQRAGGVVTASGGNHGVAVAYGAHRLGLPATVYLPSTASADRVARVARWGAQVVQHGRNWDDAHAAASAYAAEHDLPYIHPFDADKTIAGQGTLGLETLEDVPDMDCILIAVGGGGLIAGMADAIKQINPDVHIIGVEPTGAASMRAAVDAGHVVELAQVKTIADTLAPRAVSERTRQLTASRVDALVTIPDTAMVEAMRWLWLYANQLVEPSGAAVIAALQTGAADIRRFRHPVAVICGGNAGAEPVFAEYEARAAQNG